MSGIIENLGNAVTSMFRGKTPQVQPSSTKVHPIPWGLEAFPDDGSGRSLHIKTGDTLHFIPIDDDPHNVAEADIVNDDWLPARDRQLGINFRTRRGFNEQLKINKPGTYHLACPVNGHHRMMRLTVIANGSPQREQLSQQAKAQLDQAKQQARQSVQNARSCADEARQAVAQAQQQQTEAAQQRAQQAIQRADQAQQQAQNALQRLEDLARQLGQDASQVVNDVMQGVSNVANQAMNIVTSLTNPTKQIGPLGPVNNNILENVQILQGTGTFASRFPNFDLSQFNILNQNRVIGPLGPVVNRNRGVPSQRNQNDSLPAAVMVHDTHDDEITSFGPEYDDMQEEEIVSFGPGYDEQRRHSRRQKHNVAVRWDTDALLDSNGDVRTLEIPQGTVVTFRSTDGRPHNLVEVNSNFSAKKMTPLIDSEVSDRLHEVLRMNRPGTYYFISTTDPQTMRLIVKVNPRDVTDEIIDGA